jgi:coenzyme F420 hydrogenase subunit beta
MTAAFAIRDAMNDIDEAPGKTWFWELERAVIDAGRCVQCGVCIAACPSDSLGIGPDDLPKLVKMCTGCSLCWDFCPRGGLRYEALGDVLVDTDWKLTAEVSLNGHVSSNGHGHVTTAPLSRLDGRLLPLAGGDSPPGREGLGGGPSGGSPGSGGEGKRRDSLEKTRERYTARVAEPIPGVQDGGVVSVLLIELLESGQIDGALVAKPSEHEPWKGVAHLAQTREDVLACAGSFYNQTLAAKSTHRVDRHAVRDSGAAGHAGAPLLLGGLEGRGRRPHRRPPLHQELPL